jgi:hypothetical protein
MVSMASVKVDNIECCLAISRHTLLAPTLNTAGSQHAINLNSLFFVKGLFQAI